MSDYPESRAGEVPHVRRATDELDRQLEQNRAEALRHTDGFEVIEPKADKVVLPSHYARHSIEPIRFAVENYGPGFLIGNAIKYLTRYDAKDGHKDLAKAGRYIEMLRRYEAGDDHWYAAFGEDLDSWTQPDQTLRSLGYKAPGHV